MRLLYRRGRGFPAAERRCHAEFTFSGRGGCRHCNAAAAGTAMWQPSAPQRSVSRHCNVAAVGTAMDDARIAPAREIAVRARFDPPFGRGSKEGPEDPQGRVHASGRTAQAEKPAPGDPATSKEPPWARAMRSTSTSPSPCPASSGTASSGAMRARESLSSRAASATGSIPAPSSETRSSAQRVPSTVRGTSVIAMAQPSGLCRRALASRFSTRRVSIRSSPRTTASEHASSSSKSRGWAASRPLLR